MSSVNLKANRWLYSSVFHVNCNDIQKGFKMWCPQILVILSISQYHYSTFDTDPKIIKDLVCPCSPDYFFSTPPGWTEEWQTSQILMLHPKREASSGPWNKIRRPRKGSRRSSCKDAYWQEKRTVFQHSPGSPPWDVWTPGWWWSYCTASPWSA